MQLFMYSVIKQEKEQEYALFILYMPDSFSVP